MAADRTQNLQDTFLNYVRKNKTPLTIFLVNGVKLQGVVTWFDNFCVLLRRDGHGQLVYKHAISTIMPGAPISLFEGNDDSGTSRRQRLVGAQKVQKETIRGSRTRRLTERASARDATKVAVVVPVARARQRPRGQRSRSEGAA